MEQPKVIKKIEPIECPHCNKTVLISYQTMMPCIMMTSTIESVEKVKSGIRERLNEVMFSDVKEKEQVMDWLNSSSTLIDESDIEPLLKQISMEQITKIQENAKKNHNKN